MGKKRIHKTCKVTFGLCLKSMNRNTYMLTLETKKEKMERRGTYQNITGGYLWAAELPTSYFYLV